MREMNRVSYLKPKLGILFRFYRLDAALPLHIFICSKEPLYNWWANTFGFALSYYTVSYLVLLCAV